MRHLRAPHLGRRAAAGIGAIAAVVVAVGVIIATAAPGSSRGAKSPSASAGSTTVQRRDLVETDTEAGTLSYANPQTVFNRVSGTITSLPAVGQVVHPGQTLYEVDNQPVVLLNGSTPAFRDLSASDSDGPDILELNRDLVSLGFDAGDPITVNDTWQAATTDAVERWQGSLGESETGTITLGQVVFLPGPQRVTAIDTTLGSTGGSGGSASSGSGSSSDSDSSATGTSTPVVPHPEFVSLTSSRPSGTGPSGPSPSSNSGNGSSSGSSNETRILLAELKALEALLRAETQELREARANSKVTTSGRGSSTAATGRTAGAASSASRSAGSFSTGSLSAGSLSGSGAASTLSSSAGGSSSAGATAQPIMTTSSTQLVVTVDLDASKQSEAVVGEPVSVEMPNGNTVNGKITAVSPVAQTSSSSSSSSSSSGSSTSGSGSSSSATIPVTVTLPSPLSTTGLDQAAVSVNFDEQVENNVLSVPVTALLATQGGGYAVQEAAPPHQLLPVTPGLFAAGYVQISGSDIFPGLQVTDSQG